MRRHGDLKHIYGDAPTANVAARDYFAAQMRSVDRALEDGRRFITGVRFTAADIILSTCLSWAVRYGVPVSEAAAAYNSRLTARPAFMRAAEQNRAPEETAS
jgi:glutathione S-transferase